MGWGVCVWRGGGGACGNGTQGGQNMRDTVVAGGRLGCHQGWAMRAEQWTRGRVGVKGQGLGVLVCAAGAVVHGVVGWQPVGGGKGPKQ